MAHLVLSSFGSRLSTRKNIALEVSHIPGEKNNWTGDLNCNRLDSFANRQENRLRFSQLQWKKVKETYDFIRLRHTGVKNTARKLLKSATMHV